MVPPRLRLSLRARLRALKPRQRLRALLPAGARVRGGNILSDGAPDVRDRGHAFLLWLWLCILSMYFFPYLFF